jgi:UDP-3-O-[3-hydroxymyristoyl] glucosamine N-acyltransferase
MAFTLEEIVKRFGGEVVGDRLHRVGNLAPLDQAGPEHLAFLANPKYLSQVETTQAGAVLITADDFAKVAARDARNFIVTPNPYAYFARVAQAFIDLASPKVAPGVHASAHVDASAKVAASAVLGPNGSHLYPNVTVYHGCSLGERAIVQSGAVIGSDGFGFAPDFVGDGDARTGNWVKIPQVGGVKIGPDVEIGANTTIDRGAMADTVIDEGVKIDNLVQIAHNCKIGAYTVIAGCVGIAGSTTIGKHCMLGGAVGVAGHVTLGDYVIVTAKSGVSKSLPKAGIYTSAFPAVENAQWNRSAALMRNLDKMRDRIKALEAAVATQKQAGSDGA